MEKLLESWKVEIEKRFVNSGIVEPDGDDYSADELVDDEEWCDNNNELLKVVIIFRVKYVIQASWEIL